MYNQAQPQYQSSGTEEPTITLGNQEQYSNSRGGAKNRRKQHPLDKFAGEQQGQNYRNHYEKELQICHSELQTLKEQIQIEQQQKRALEDTIIQMKRQRASADNENRQLFQQNERNRQLVQKLKIDNKSMEMEIEKFKQERRVYYSNYNNIQGLKRDLTVQLDQKTHLIDQLHSKLRKSERNNADSKFKIEELEKEFSDTQRQKDELKTQIRNTLQKFFARNNELTQLKYELKEVSELNKRLKEKVFQVQKEKEDLLIKLGYDVSDSKRKDLSQSNRSTYTSSQKAMFAIDSYMKGIGNKLDLKREEIHSKSRNYEQLRAAITGLEILL